MDTSSPKVIPDEVRGFLEGMLNDASITALDDDAREDMIRELFVRLDSFMATRLLDQLPKEKVEEFIRMNEEKKSREELELFIKDNIPNAAQFFANIFTDFRESYLGKVAVNRAAPKAEATQE
jgi:hypothetical protein